MALPREATALMNALNNLNAAASPAQLASLSRRVSRAADDLELVCEETSDTALFKQLSSYILRAREAVKSARIKARQAALNADRNALIQPPPQSELHSQQGTAGRLAAEINDALRRTAAIVGEEIQRSNVAGDVVEESTRRLKLTRNQHVTYGETVTSGQSTLKSIRRTELFANFVVVLCFALFFVAAAYVANRRLQNSNINAFIVRPTVNIASTPFRITAWLFRTAFSTPDSRYDTSSRSDMHTFDHAHRTSTPPVKEKKTVVEAPPATSHQADIHAHVGERETSQPATQPGSEPQQSSTPPTAEDKPLIQPDTDLVVDVLNSEQVPRQPLKQPPLQERSLKDSEIATVQHAIELKAETKLEESLDNQPKVDLTSESTAQEHHERLPSSAPSVAEQPELERHDSAESELQEAPYYQRESHDANESEAEQDTISERHAIQSTIETDVVNESEALVHKDDASPSDTSAGVVQTDHTDLEDARAEKGVEGVSAGVVSDSSEHDDLRDSGTEKHDEGPAGDIVDNVQQGTSDFPDKRATAEERKESELSEAIQDAFEDTSQSIDDFGARPTVEDDDKREAGEIEDDVEFHKVDNGDIVDGDKGSELNEEDEDTQLGPTLSTEGNDSQSSAEGRNLSEPVDTEYGAGDHKLDMAGDEPDSEISTADADVRTETTQATDDGVDYTLIDEGFRRQPRDTEDTTGDHDIEKGEKVADMATQASELLKVDGDGHADDLQSTSNDESRVGAGEVCKGELADRGDVSSDDVDAFLTNTKTKPSKDGDDMIIAENSSQEGLHDAEDSATDHEDTRGEIADDGEDLFDAAAVVRAGPVQSADDDDPHTAAGDSSEKEAFDAEYCANANDGGDVEVMEDGDETEISKADSDTRTGPTQSTDDDVDRTQAEDGSPREPLHADERGEDREQKHARPSVKDAVRETAKQCSTESESGSCRATLTHGVCSDQKSSSSCRRPEICSLLGLPSCLRTSLTPVTV